MVTSYGLYHHIIIPEEEVKRAPRCECHQSSITPSVKDQKGFGSLQFSATSSFGSGLFSPTQLKPAQPETNKVSWTLSPNWEIPAQDTNLTPNQISGHFLCFTILNLERRTKSAKSFLPPLAWTANYVYKGGPHDSTPFNCLSLSDRTALQTTANGASCCTVFSHPDWVSIWSQIQAA